jgi:outer membrane immunogenic protein
MLGATFRATFFGTLATGAVLAGPVVAADLPVKAPIKPSAPAAYNWTGIYVGVDVGGGWGRKNWTFVDTIPPGFGGIPAGTNEGGHDVSGWLAGGQIGANWQTGSWVLGAELKWDWADLTGKHHNFSAPGDDGLRTKVKSVGLLTGRVGYAWDNLLLYGKGGGGWVRDKYERSFGNTSFGQPVGTVFASAKEWRWGWTAGAGLEYGFAPSWSAAIEYDYIGLGTRRVRFAELIPSLNFLPFDEDIRQDLHLVTFRVNYRIGAGPPPVGR